MICPVTAMCVCESVCVCERASSMSEVDASNTVQNILSKDMDSCNIVVRWCLDKLSNHESYGAASYKS